ncbi:TPA: hypothetical protein DDW69_01825 [candidate division CPR2 bacterium]|nr:MAG: hypothetical protein A2Y27_01830 [candidate division CPR2 bacterium GWD1_39_7]OGB71207.1 MAG: hypothetical protein A2Y26_00845 [candidate division CPR2 bacterium GWD2_39_7]HBG81559.1 hypothetical protein [candidate division CPR2 bacterium]HCL99476.1 hypothetical protein [candidate division CPR2 bacterium]
MIVRILGLVLINAALFLVSAVLLYWIFNLLDLVAFYPPALVMDFVIFIFISGWLIGNAEL